MQHVKILCMLQANFIPFCIVSFLIGGNSTQQSFRMEIKLEHTKAYLSMEYMIGISTGRKNILESNREATYLGKTTDTLQKSIFPILILIFQNTMLIS